MPLCDECHFRLLIIRSRGHTGCEAKTPLLGKGGVAAPSIKCRGASIEGADGVVGPTSEQICDEVDRTTPCPSFAKEGNSHPGVTCVQSSGHRPRPQRTGLEMSAFR